MNFTNRLSIALFLPSFVLGTTACTRNWNVGTMFEDTHEPPSKYLTIDEEFIIKDGQIVQVTVPKPVDILVAIDNSSSMGDEQNALAAGMASFSDNYLKADKDIRVGFIKSDTYKAGDISNANFSYIVPTVGVDVNDYARLFPETNGGLSPPVPVAIADRADSAVISTVVPSGQSEVDHTAYIKAQFSKLTHVGTGGNSAEDNLKSMERLLDVNEAGLACNDPARHNPCMFRSGDVVKVLVHVTDEGPSIIKDSTTRANFKAKLDGFFKGLTGKDDPQYFMVSISGYDCKSDLTTFVSTQRKYNDFVSLIKSDVSNSLASHSSDNPVHPPVFKDTGQACNYAGDPIYQNTTNYAAYFDGVAQTLQQISGSTISASRFGLKSAPLVDVPTNLPIITLFVDGLQPEILTQDKFSIKGQDLTLNIKAEDYPVGSKITIRYYILNDIVEGGEGSSE